MNPQGNKKTGTYIAQPYNTKSNIIFCETVNRGETLKTNIMGAGLFLGLINENPV